TGARGTDSSGAGTDEGQRETQDRPNGSEQGRLELPASVTGTVKFESARRAWHSDGGAFEEDDDESDGESKGDGADGQNKGDGDTRGSGNGDTRGQGDGGEKRNRRDPGRRGTRPQGSEESPKVEERQPRREPKLDPEQGNP